MATTALGTLLSAASPPLLAAEHVTLRNGFEIDCARREAIEGGRVRLFMLPTTPGQDSPSFIDVALDSVIEVESFPDPVLPPPAGKPEPPLPAELTPAEMHTMLAKAGTQHHIDEDLLASVVKAESGGHVMAISRTGAQGLMQLMPGTANELGVADAFRPEQNIAGGTAYLDQLLVRYHDNAALALAAYNAGPGAVDKYHGIPPYRETRAYVARVIREFNRRKIQAAALNKSQIQTQVQTQVQTQAQMRAQTDIAGVR
jgi:soluble lytic murein transglycosylase-like protein